MKSALLRWIVLALAVWAASAVVPGILYDDWQSLLLAAVALGILNTLVKPVLRVLSLPFIVVTLGLFLLVINALLLRLAAWLVPGFHVAGFWPAVGGSLVISLVSFLLGSGRDRRSHLAVESVGSIRTMPRRPPPGTGPIIDL